MRPTRRKTGASWPSRAAPSSHDLSELAQLAGDVLSEDLFALQVFAVEARYEEKESAVRLAREGG